MHVYKFGSTHVHKTLSQQRIKVSLATELNDPFELSPRVDASKFTVELAMQFLRQDHQLDDWYAKEGRQKGFTNKKRYKAHYLQTLRQRAEALMPKVPQNVEAARAAFAVTFSAHWRLFCTSLRNDSILMWSHYAKDHTGAVIGFESESPPFSQLGSNYVVPVSYSETKPEFFYRPGKVASFESAMRSVVRSKSVDWSYEKEVRFMFPSTSCIQGQFIRFPSNTVRSVTLGARMPSDERKAYHTLLSENRYVHVAIYEAKLSKDHYTLEFDATRPGNA